MSRQIIRTIAVIALIAVSGCATLKGMGTDLSNVSDALVSG